MLPQQDQPVRRFFMLILQQHSSNFFVINTTQHVQELWGFFVLKAKTTTSSLRSQCQYSFGNSLNCMFHFKALTAYSPLKRQGEEKDFSKEHKRTVQSCARSQALLTVLLRGMCTFRYVDFQLEERSLLLDAYLNSSRYSLLEEKNCTLHVQRM